MPHPIIVDAHEDIAYNKLAHDRDFLESALIKRNREGPNPANGRGSATVGLDELIAGNVRVVFATLYVKPASAGDSLAGKSYSTAQEAYDQAMEQLGYYQSLTRDPRVVLIDTRAELDRVLNGKSPMVGFVILMEGADPIIEPDQTQDWFDRGVRIVGPAWSKTRYSGGTRAPGALTDLGRALMPAMKAAGMILDTSHMAEASFFEALELFEGTVIASHSNCRLYVNTDRQLSDGMIHAIVARDGVIGAVIYNRFIKENWDKGSKKSDVTLKDVVRHIQHICDLAGDALHVGIGTDFDGGFGAESIPAELDTVADLHRIGDALADAKFDDAEIEGILGGNWLRVLKNALPK